jgi:uncharacterized protein YjbJ (UPF0337 family)
MDDNRVKGAARNVGGKVKEGVGRAVGDEKLKREGQVDQVSGKVENAVGGLKDEVRENRELRDREDPRH